MRNDLYNLEEGADREQEDEVRHVLRQRQQRASDTSVHTMVTCVLGGVTLLLWGSVYADARHDPAQVLTKGYAAFLGMAIVIGIWTAAAAAAASSVRDARRRAAEEDLIRECHQQQQLSAIRDAITVFLRDGDESALKAMAQTRGLLDTGTDPEVGTVHRFRGRR